VKAYCHHNLAICRLPSSFILSSPSAPPSRMIVRVRVRVRVRIRIRVRVRGKGRVEPPG